MSLPTKPQSRVENYLGVIVGQETAVLPQSPQSRVEDYLDYIAKNGTKGSVKNAYFFNNKMYEDEAHTKEITLEEGKLYYAVNANALYAYYGGTLKLLAKGASGETLVYNTYSSMVTAFNGFTRESTPLGTSVRIRATQVPDLWVAVIETDYAEYTYTSDEDLINLIRTQGYVKIGYYLLSSIETGEYTKEQIDSMLDLKADLVRGKVPVSQLPTVFTPDIVEVDTFDNLPDPGDTTVTYYVLDTQKSYRWLATANRYLEITQSQNYTAVTIPIGITMSELNTIVNAINVNGEHVFFDMHEFINEGYVCTVHFWNSTIGSVVHNYCEINDILNDRLYGVKQEWTSSQLIGDYCSASGLMYDVKKISVNGVDLTNDRGFVDITTDDLDAVSYSSQTKTDAKKLQARTNIGTGVRIVDTDDPQGDVEMIDMETMELVEAITAASTHNEVATAKAIHDAMTAAIAAAKPQIYYH